MIQHRFLQHGNQNQIYGKGTEINVKRNNDRKYLQEKFSKGELQVLMEGGIYNAAVDAQQIKYAYTSHSSDLSVHISLKKKKKKRRNIVMQIFKIACNLKPV